MAGTCNDCGAPTWGRYRICPDCRKARKRKGGYSSSRSSGSGERWVCNSCGYGWRSKKSFGSPAVCPRCKESDITPYAKTPAGKREFIMKIIFVVGIFVAMFIFINSSAKHYDNERANSPQALAEQAKQECLSSGGFYYSQTCTPLESIQNHKNLCNSDGMKPIIFLTGSGGNWDCYKGKIESDKLSESQKTEVLNCENLGNVPVITDKVNCVELTSSPQSSSQETISPEEELTNFCISQFSNEGIFDLKKTDYQNDFSSASDWIRNNYENSALTQEQKEHNINYIIENQLPKQGYPIIITSGSKKDGQITSQGFYYCNENGVI